MVCGLGFRVQGFRGGVGACDSEFEKPVGLRVQGLTCIVLGLGLSILGNYGLTSGGMLGLY